MEHVKAEWRSFNPPWGKMFHIHWALETSLGREPGRIVTDLLAGTEPIVIWFSLHYRKPDENTYCLQTQHMDLIELSAVGILERASGTIICTLNNQVTCCSGIKRWSMRVSIIWWGCLFVCLFLENFALSTKQWDHFSFAPLNPLPIRHNLCISWGSER